MDKYKLFALGERKNFRIKNDSSYIAAKSFIFKREKERNIEFCTGKKTSPFQELCRYSSVYSYILSGHRTVVCLMNLFKLSHKKAQSSKYQHKEDLKKTNKCIYIKSH